MIYTPQTKRAMCIAFKAHGGQKDRAGIPYINHPLHLAEQMKTEDETCVALLHDVVEDTDIDFRDLRDAGFSEAVLDALRLLTHDKSVSYMDYIKAVKTNPLAAAVKRADLRHNMDISRLDNVTDKDRERIEKYAQALELLNGKGGMEPHE